MQENTGAATSSSRSHRHSRFLKSLSSPFPFLALLKSRSDGLLRHSPLPLPRPTRKGKQTARWNSQTGKRTGSRKKNTETARGQRPEWGGPRAKMARGSARSRRSFLGTPSQRTPDWGQLPADEEQQAGYELRLVVPPAGRSERGRAGKDNDGAGETKSEGAMTRAEASASPRAAKEMRERE